AYANLRPATLLYVERAALDDSGRLQLMGWAVSLSPVASIVVHLGNERIEGVRAGGRRDDVGSAFPAYPNARTSGFSFTGDVVAEADAAARGQGQSLTPRGFSQE